MSDGETPDARKAVTDSGRLAAPHFQVRLLARISGLVQSEFIAERLREGSDSQGILEIVRAADPAIVEQRMPFLAPAGVGLHPIGKG